ncbi:LysR family transcriptional regulator [Microbacterium lacticum]
MAVSLAQFRALVAVTDHGGFAAAADELGITQSAVSHAVAALESELGAVLAVRKPVFALTATGAEVLPHARSALASADALVSAAAEVGNRAGTVRLAAPSTVCFGLLPGLLSGWQSAFPSITVRVFEGDDPELVAWLDDGTVDAAILVNPEHPHPDAVTVDRDEYRAVVRNDHPLADAERIEVVDLLDDSVLVSGGGCGPEVTAMFRRHDPRFRPAQRVYDNAALLNFVAAGLGITVFPSIGSGMLAPGTRMLPLDPPIERALVFSGPSNRPWNPLVQALRDTLPASENGPDRKQ